MPQLVEPDVVYHRSFLAAMAEDPVFFAKSVIPATGELTDPAAFARYVQRLRDDARPESPRAAGLVPQTTGWWVEGEDFLARVGIRHRLNERLRSFGGHIGYWTRPGARRQGHAGAAFRASLPVAYALGVDPALVTCDWNNEPSRRIIESAGGMLERRHKQKLLFWIPTGPPSAGQ